ncbi:MAG TPA: hypothetical protein VGI90_15730 [Steroidobacteraceae bacterium]|jgi:hypothetical protein
MQNEILCERRWTLAPCILIALLLSLAACKQSELKESTQAKGSARAQLSIGYSLLYQEADGIPKLKWLLMFKDKPEQMGRLTSELIDYYRHLAETIQRLSKQYPALRIDAQATSEIEAKERKAMGDDLAKDFAPIVGRSGIEFEREALLMFYNSLNEQRHLAAVMVGLEPDPGLKQFLATTQAQLERRYEEVGGLLKRHYFTK